MLTIIIKPKQGQKAGKFGYSGKMIINPFSIPKELNNEYKKIFLKFVKISICGCWEWLGRTHNGYPCCLTPGGSTKWAHRISYALFNGPIEKQMHIDHKCRNPLCVNPSHLQQLTPTQNYRLIQIRKLQDNKKLMEENGQMTLWNNL